MDVASHAPPDPTVADRPPVARGELRRRIVRGTVVNAVALVTIDLLVLAQGLIVTRLLGPAAIGLYGIVTVTTTTIVAAPALWVRHIGATLRLVRERPGPLEIERVEPRYRPQLRVVCRVPGVRELVTWNRVIRVRRRA